MDMYTALALLLLLFLVPTIFLLIQAPYPGIPNVLITDYLPGGPVFKLLVDPRKTSASVASLASTLGHVYHFYLGPRSTLATANLSDCKQILSSPAVFDRPPAMYAMFKYALPASIFEMPLQQHRQARRSLRDRFNFSLLPGFHNPTLAAITELKVILTKLAQNSTDDAGFSDVFDITNTLQSTVLAVITNVSFGASLTSEQRIQFIRDSDTFITQMLDEMMGYPFRPFLALLGARRKLVTSKAAIWDICRTIVENRLHETAEQCEKRYPDLLDAILELHKEDLLNAALTQTVVFVIAGAHTSNISMAWTIHEISRHPHVEKAILEELNRIKPNINEPLTLDDVNKLVYLTAVWRETLRIHSPGAFFLRQAVKDVTLRGSGVHVPSGKQILVLLQFAQKDPAGWKDAHEFVPERWLREDGSLISSSATPGLYLPFSAGQRNCPGQFFADYQGVLVVSELMRRFSFKSGCRDGEVPVVMSGWVETGRYASVPGGKLDMGIPLRVKLR